MSHEIFNAAVARNRLLRDSDVSRFGTLRLVIQTQGLDKVICSLIIERIGGGRISGTRLAFTVLPRRDVNGRTFTPVELLGNALDSLRSEP